MQNHIKNLLLLFPLAFLFSCKKERVEEIKPMDENVSLDSSVTYKMIITGTWKMPQHTVPVNNHFTQFIGMVHSDSSALYKLGALASLGVENVAEVGNSTALKTEMDNMIAAGKALNKFFVTLSTITASDTTTIQLNIKHFKISFVSMIAPSPDWFAGIESYGLIQNGKWVKDITLPVWGYDAGTEDADVFGYNNPATVPQQPISLMTPANASVIANGNSTIAPFAMVRFVKL